MSENKSNELKVSGGYADTEMMSILQEAMLDDCQGMDFTLDKVGLPVGGSTAFELPGEGDGDTTVVKDITGVILYNHPAFAYYTEKYTGAAVPPECSSFDGVNGTGIPGGACATCPYNQYGSGEGKSKACKNKRFVYILREGEIFPIVLSLPAGSLGTFIKYTKHQLSKKRRLNQVVTKISLKKATSGAGITFSQAVFSFVRSLDSAEMNVISAMTTQVKEYAASLTSAVLIEHESTAPMVNSETGEVIEPLA